MKIVFISSECVPFASTGGLGEVVGSLPVALARMGHEVVRIVPLYRHVAEGGFPLDNLNLPMTIPLGLRSPQAEVYETFGGGVRTYFIGRDEFFDRRELYSLPHRDYDDNFERFVFFQKAAVELVDTLRLAPHIVHAHDWQTGLIPFFLRHGIHGLGRPHPENCVFTIHNLAYQGVFAGSEFAHTNLPYSCFTMDGMEFYGQISCLKSGIVASDRITTVSHTYAQEIQSEEYGYGLDGVLRDKDPGLKGILNGINTEIWDPATDPHLAANYDADGAVEAKAVCRKDLLKKFGLTRRGNARVFGMVSRLVDLKGVDVLAEAMPMLMERNLRFVLLGSGQDLYHELCRHWAQRWPERFACRLGFDHALAHKIYAGADFVLMPSKTEPCGLVQMVGMRYGALPVVHATGGLVDTVTDVREGESTGTGFAFSPCTAEALVAAVDRALALGKHEEAMDGAVRRAMAEDYSWAKSAGNYTDLYQSLARGRE